MAGPELAYIAPTRQLQPIDLVAPGFRGLNLEQQAGILSPAYASEASNAVIDSTGRLAARAGITNITTTPISASPVVRTIFEYKKIDNTVADIVAWDGGISTSVSNPSGSDISGAVTDSSGIWRFLNFNNKIIGVQSGQKPIVYTGTGNFATVAETSGTAPTAPASCAALAAFGRVWVVDSDYQTIKYSGLLNETQWNSGGAGLIDMRNVWTSGTDVVRALAAFNGALIVFGYRHIVFWRDTNNSALGIDPADIYVSDVIAGTGCVSQFSVQHVDNSDLVFLSPNGVQSLSRLLVQQSNPIYAQSKYVRTEVIQHANAEAEGYIRSTYNPLMGAYLLSFPTSSTVWVFDQKRLYQDDQGDVLPAITRWNLSLTAMHTKMSMSMYVAKTAGKVALYGGDTDEGSSFRFIYYSPWLDLGEELANREKILKRLGAIVYVVTQTSLIFKWATDFSVVWSSETYTISGDGASEYGIAEYGIGEYSGGLSLRIVHVPVRDRGQYYRIGLEADITSQLSVQQIEMNTKIGRLA